MAELLSVREVDESELEHRRFEKAQHVAEADYENMVVYTNDVLGGDLGECYWTIDALCEHCEQENIELPEYAWACESQTFSLEAEHIIEDEAERSDWDLDMVRDHISIKQLAELQSLLDDWCAKVNLECWQQDVTRAVILKQDNTDASEAPDSSHADSGAEPEGGA
jgi:hypothetical protein